MPTHVYLVAGEDSGDRLGAGLMGALKTKRPDTQFSGIGGTRMQAQGLISLFPMSELSLMGFFEVLPHLPRLLKRIRETAEDIIAKKPDVVVTIDSPGFTFRLAKLLRKKGCAAKLVHYVAPSVWAWKPGRAKTTAQLFDHLLCLLPFEPPYFEKEGLNATWVGHPAIYENRHLATLCTESKAFREQHAIGTEAPILAFLPGSRAGELKRHLSIFVEVAAALEKRHPDLVTVWPVDARFAEMVKRATGGLRRAIILTDEKDRQLAVAASSTALVKSGTITLEVALSGAPMIVTYRINPLSAFLLRRMIRVQWYSLINIAANEEILPEYMQEKCDPAILSDALDGLLENNKARERQREKSLNALKTLGVDAQISPSELAADAILKLL